MTFSPVGSVIGPFAGPTTFTLAPAFVGDLILIEVTNNTGTGSGIATALSSSNVTWSAYGSGVTGVTNAGYTAQVFAGLVTSTSSQTVTITWTATAPTAHVGVEGYEFSSSAGAWAFDKSGDVDSAGTNTWASLTPAVAGELYFGYCLNSSTAEVGTTTGFFYKSDSSGNGSAYNVNCAATAQAPVWADSTQVFGMMVLVKEVFGGPGQQAGRQMPNRPAYQVFSAGRTGGGHSW